MLDQLIDDAQTKWPPNRVAIALGILLTPILLVLTATVTAWLAAHFPGLPQLTPAAVVAVVVPILVAVATAVITLLYKYLDGWQKREAARHQLIGKLLEHPLGPAQGAAELESALFPVIAQSTSSGSAQ